MLAPINLTNLLHQTIRSDHRPVYFPVDMLLPMGLVNLGQHLVSLLGYAVFSSCRCFFAEISLKQCVETSMRTSDLFMEIKIIFISFVTVIFDRSNSLQLVGEMKIKTAAELGDQDVDLNLTSNNN